MAFSIESDPTLAAAVGPPASPLPLTGVSGAGSLTNPYLLPATPWEFLLAAGRATAAIFSPFKQLFEISSHWAVARWFWAIDWSSTDIALSPYAGEIRNHHRAAFSEAMGLAAALLVAEHQAGDTLPAGLWRGGPMLVDVDSLGHTGQRPDLLIFFGQPAHTTYVIEAKGNRTGRDVSIKQLQRGIGQVLALAGTAERLVVGAAAPGPSLTVHAITVQGQQSKSPGGRRRLAAAEEQAFAMEMRRLASFAGAAGLGEGDWNREGSVFAIPQLGRQIVGRSFVLAGEGLSAEISMGVDREIVENLSQVRSLKDLAALRARVNAADNHRTPPGNEAQLSLMETGRAAAVALDGCALSISLR